MIRVIPRQPRADSRCIVALVGAPPDRAVSWTASAGTLHILSDRTDARGRAFAVLEPAGAGVIQVEAVYGAE